MTTKIQEGQARVGSQSPIVNVTGANLDQLTHGIFGYIKDDMANTYKKADHKIALNQQLLAGDIYGTRSNTAKQHILKAQADINWDADYLKKQVLNLNDNQKARLIRALEGSGILGTAAKPAKPEISAKMQNAIHEALGTGVRVPERTNTQTARSAWKAKAKH